MDKAKARIIAEDARAALEAVAKRHGLTVQIAGGKYDDYAGTYEPKVRFTEAGEGAERQAWEKQCRLLGLKTADYGKTVTIRGERWTAYGIEPKRSRFSVRVRNEAGKTMLTTPEALGAKPLSEWTTKDFEESVR